MRTMTADELPDFVNEAFPRLGLRCIADFTRDSISIQHGNEEVAAFTEEALEEGKITDKMVVERIENWRKKTGR